MSERLELLRQITTAFGDVVRELSQRDAGGSTMPPGGRRRSIEGRHVVYGAACAGLLAGETILMLTLLDLIDQAVSLIELWSELGARQLQNELDSFQ